LTDSVLRSIVLTFNGRRSIVLTFNGLRSIVLTFNGLRSIVLPTYLPNSAAAEYLVENVLKPQKELTVITSGRRLFPT